MRENCHVQLIIIYQILEIQHSRIHFYENIQGGEYFGFGNEHAKGQGKQNSNQIKCMKPNENSTYLLRNMFKNIYKFSGFFSMPFLRLLARWEPLLH